MDNQRNVRQGTLDTLIRNAASLGPLHGCDWDRMGRVITGILRTTSEGL
jgi:hypothetical protein